MKHLAENVCNELWDIIVDKDGDRDETKQMGMKLAGEYMVKGACYLKIIEMD